MGWRRCRAEAERALKASSALLVSRVESGTARCECTQLRAPPEAPETWAADSLAQAVLPGPMSTVVERKSCAAAVGALDTLSLSPP